MASVNRVFTVDSHVGGEPLRLITGGLPHLRGNSITEKKTHFETRFDHIRKALILEPRGHDNMFGAVLCDPVDPRADAGIFFMHTVGYLNMCGHGIIGAVTSMIEGGLLDRDIIRTTEVVLETPAGLVSASAKVEDDGTVEAVAIKNVPSFVLHNALAMTVRLPGYYPSGYCIRRQLFRDDTGKRIVLESGEKKSPSIDFPWNEIERHDQ